jgi:curved DNA-binding protein CbpA
MSADIPDYYAVLEVRADSSLEAIRKSYRRLALKFHPDKNPDNPTAAAEKFKLISEAFSILSDSARRQEYDRDRSNQQHFFHRPDHFAFTDAQGIFNNFFHSFGGFGGVSDPFFPAMPSFGLFGGSFFPSQRNNNFFAQNRNYNSFLQPNAFGRGRGNISAGFADFFNPLQAGGGGNALIYETSNMSYDALGNEITTNTVTQNGKTVTNTTIKQRNGEVLRFTDAPNSSNQLQSSPPRSIPIVDNNISEGEESPGYQSLSSERSEAMILCDRDHGEAAELHCADCKQDLCEHCDKIIHSSNLFANHRREAIGGETEEIKSQSKEKEERKAAQQKKPVEVIDLISPSPSPSPSPPPQNINLQPTTSSFLTADQANSRAESKEIHATALKNRYNNPYLPEIERIKLLDEKELYPSSARSRSRERELARSHAESVNQRLEQRNHRINKARNSNIAGENQGKAQERKEQTEGKSSTVLSNLPQQEQLLQPPL